MSQQLLHNPNLFEKIAKNRVIIHILYWVLWVCFFGFMWGTYDNDYGKTFSIELFELPLKIVVVYINIYVLMPRLLFQNKTLEYLGSVFVLLLAGGILRRVITFFIVEPMYWPERSQLGFFELTANLQAVLGVITPMIMPLAAKLFQYWYRSQQEKQLLEHENLQVELKLLKSQIHPHFLFNTLNSLYALSLKKSEKTPEVVMKLSELMHFMLYDCKQAKIPLSRELKFIENYIDLEQVRFEGRFELKFEVDTNLDRVEISPLMLLPFVENCFKHAVNTNFESTNILLELRVKEEKILFRLKNSLNENAGGRKVNLSSGFGLKNVQRRLALLYPDQHSLTINHEDSSYLVNLELHLNAG